MVEMLLLCFVVGAALTAWVAAGAAVAILLGRIIRLRDSNGPSDINNNP